MFSTIIFAASAGLADAIAFVRHTAGLPVLIGAGSLLLGLSNCNNGPAPPAPRVVGIQSFGRNDVLGARIDPNGTEVRKVEFQFGRRPSLQHAQAIIWTEGVHQYSVDRNEQTVYSDPPFTGPFRAYYEFEQDWELQEGEIIDYHVLITYRRPGDTTDWKFWGDDHYFVADPPHRQSTRCDLEYRRSSGPLEDHPNMSTEKMQCFAIKIPQMGVPPSEWQVETADFITSWSHQGRLREGDGFCFENDPCYGSHGRLLRNVGENRLHVVLVESPSSARRVIVEPGDELSIRADIAQVSCSKFIDPDEFMRAFCNAQPSSEICTP